MPKTGKMTYSTEHMEKIRKENEAHDALDRKEEREYKYKIVDLLARALHPGWYDPKEAYTPSGRKTLQNMAEANAKRGLRAIADYIKPVGSD